MQPIEPPSRVAIARGLCSVASRLPNTLNVENGCLEDAEQFLSEEPPNVIPAMKCLDEAYAHAFRGLHKETRPEVWLHRPVSGALVGSATGALGSRA